MSSFTNTLTIYESINYEEGDRYYRCDIRTFNM